MTSKLFNKGIALGRERYTHISKRGSKWKSRNIPKFIREHLLVPYYFTENGGRVELWVIGYNSDGKVGFELFGKTANEASQIYVRSKPEG